MYEQGQGTPQDNQEALKWYTKAAEQGDADAQDSLGRMFEEGRGVARDSIRAHTWYSLAAASSAKPDLRRGATSDLEWVAAQITAQQIAQAREMARRCRQSNFKNCH